MATIRVKRTTGSSTPSGLTFGEPAYVQGLKSLYIGQTGGDPAIRVGAEVSTDSTFAAASDNKLPSQLAVKTYVDSAITSNTAGVASVNGLTGALFIGAGTAISVTAAGTGITVTNTGVQSITGTANEIEVSGSTGAVTIGLPNDVTIGNNLTVTGNLTVNGNTTTVNSNVTTVDDPIFLLGTSGGLPIAASDGAKDRGIAFTYFDSVGKTGFFGYDASTQRFTFVPDAGITNEVVGGSIGNAEFSTLYANTSIILSGGLGYHTMTSASSVAASAAFPDWGGEVLLTSNSNTANYIVRGSAVGAPSWIDPNSAGFTAYAAGRLETARTIGLTGDISGSASFDGTANINISTTIAPNSVALGTDTTGNYLATITTSSTGLTLSGSGVESAAVTINLATITSGLNMELFTFAASEFINTSGTVSIGVVDGGSF